MVGIKNTRGIALALANRTVVVQQLAQLFHRIAHVGAQHVFTKKLVKHLPHRAFKERHAARMAWTVPAVRAVFSIVKQSFKERWLNTLEVAFGLANDVTRHKLGRVFKHMNKAVQFAQNVIGQVTAGLGFAVHINGHLKVFAAHLLNELTQALHRWILARVPCHLFVIDRQDKGTGAALLLGKLAQVAVAGHAQHFKTFGL